MAEYSSEIAQKLMKAFVQFRKTPWHDKKISGFNPSEFRVLAAIQREANEKNTEMKVSEISQLLKVTPPTITQIINILDKDDLIERSVDPDDRRAVKIKLSPAGIEATNNARRSFSDSFIGLIDYLGEDESEKLVKLLSKVDDYFIQKTKE